MAYTSLRVARARTNQGASIHRHYFGFGTDNDLETSRACGVEHPADIGAQRLTILDERFGNRSAADIFGIEGEAADS